MSGDLGLLGGVLMGLAGSLHCAGVCGGVASSLLLATTGPTRPTAAAQGQALLAAQLGRATTYTVFGAVVGLGGAGLAGLLALAGAQAALRGLAGAALILSGLSIAGLAPSVVHTDRLIGGALRRVFGSSRRTTAPYALGLAWGLAPCGMVYAALTNAMLSGSAIGGATFMAGFGLATAPAVAAAAFGARTLAGIGLRARGQLRLTLGLTLAGLGALSLVEPAMALSALCLNQ